jgi:capsular polysaccharide export protein
MRRFLFLQGPPGPFFRELAVALRCAGCAVDRVNFNGGDQLDWRGPAITFRGDGAAWTTRIPAILAEHAITDLLLFGDCRPLHRTAIKAAHLHGVAVHVFEEGYIRPDWVTLERGGVNGHSALPRSAGYYCEAALHLPRPHPLPQVPASFGQRARDAIGYYGASALLTRRFPLYRSHRPQGHLAEAAGWLWRAAAHAGARRRSRAVLRALCAPYFIVPLQLDSDYQLRLHSPFGGMMPAIAAILASFAAHGSTDSLLLFKGHPLDNGLQPWRRRVAGAAAAYRLSERVRFVECGDIAALVAHARGVVTVNSTTGTLALAAGVPVKVLGRAVYDVPGITHQGTLDQFWQAPDRPQWELFDAFRRVVAHHCLLRGGFSSREGRALLIEPAVRRLLAPAAELPLRVSPVQVPA